MEISLRRIDFEQVGTTSKRCMLLFPPTGQSPLQKVVVGGQNGVLFSFGRKKTENVVAFKTLPGSRIDCMALGGALGTSQDKVFFASGGVIKGFSRKGRQFFTFETNLTDNISSMYVYGVDMLLCGAYTFNHYHDCKDFHYYLVNDKINDVISLPIVEGSWVGRGLTPVLACDDRTVRVLDGSNLAYQIEVGGPPTCLHLFQNTGGSDGQEVLYGTRDGKIGLLELPQYRRNNPRIIWEINSTTGNASITCMDCYDITNDGYLELIVGRDDGLVEIYGYDEADRPQLKQTFQCNESINAIQCGRVSSANFDEIIVCTYAGWIFSLTTEPAVKETGPSMQLQEMAVDPESDAKIQQLKSEIDQLQQRVQVERERYQSITQRKDAISAVPVFSINDRFLLSKDEAAYMLSVELQVPIDYILLQCDVPVDLLDVDKNSAVVSLTPCDPVQSGNCLLATYRCQVNTTRLDMKLRSIEGQHGTLQVYVSPRLHPKTCQVRQYQIKPLSLHQRAQMFDEARPQNILKLTGQFTMAEAHSWTVFCLPEVSEKPPALEKVEFCFLSTFTGTMLHVTHTKGSAVYRSDSISTIAILKDVLSKETTRKKIRLDISCDISDDSIAHNLQLLHPKLEYQLNLAKKVHLIEALQELTLNENDTSFLSTEYIDILKNADKLQDEFRNQQAHLERIYGIITDLYIDKHKFKGQNMKQKVPELLQVLDNYSLESLQQFFQLN